MSRSRKRCFHKTKKASTFQSRLPYLFYFHNSKRWLPSYDFRTLPDESLRLQFPFVFRRLHSLQLLLPFRSVFLSSVATLAILLSVFSFINTFFQNFLNFLFFIIFSNIFFFLRLSIHFIK